MGRLAITFLTLMFSVTPILAGEPDYRTLIKLKPETNYACQMGHLHIRGKAENTADVTLTRILIEGRVYGEEGTLLSTAPGRLDRVEISPHEAALFDIEFVDVTGPRLEEVKRLELKVLRAEPKQ